MQIHTYAAECDSNGVRRELDRGVPVDARDERDFTPLACAVSSPNSNVEVLQILIEAGADVNASVDSSKNFPIGLAACSGDLPKVQLLLDAGANINFASPNGYTILINIAYSLHDSKNLVPMIEFLVRNGANTDCETEYGESPMSVTSRLGRFDAVQSLLNAGADSARLKWTDLMKAVALGTSEDVQRLLAAGSPLDARDRWDRTAWLLTSLVGDLEKAKLLHSAGASINDKCRGGDTALMQCAARDDSEMLSWLIEIGTDIEAQNDFTNTALMIAAGSGATTCARLLLEAGADPSRRNEYKENSMSKASNRDIFRLLSEAGEDIADISTELKRKLTGLLDGDSLNVSQSEYREGCRPRFGNANPELMDVPLWREMVRSGISAYQAKAQFGDEHNMEQPTWCFSRFGGSFTELPDGRFVQIGGEHEDHYDPDFCIYNEVIVHDPSADFQIFGYPKNVFPPTDFHSASYVDGFIYIIGRLGYHGSRQFGTTPVFRLNCATWRMEPVQTSGENPGWIYEHKCQFENDGVFVVSGGKICNMRDGEEHHDENTDTFCLDLVSMKWTRS